MSPGPEQAGRTLCPAAPPLGSSAAQLSGHPRTSCWPLIYLLLWLTSAGPRAAAAPSPPRPLPTRAFDSAPAANGFMTEALQTLRRHAPHGSITPGPAKGPSCWHGNSGVN